MNDKKTALGDVVSILYLTPDNAVVGVKNEFLTLTLTAPGEDGETETKEYDRIFLHRSFPFDHPESYISVQDTDKNEIGMISDLAVFPQETADLMRRELERKYYAPVLTSIRSVKDKYGYAYCTATTAEGEITFTLKDAARSFLKVDKNRVVITDVDGNRYDIPDLSALDKNSYKKIELYL